MWDDATPPADYLRNTRGIQVNPINLISAVIWRATTRLRPIAAAHHAAPVRRPAYQRRERAPQVMRVFGKRQFKRKLHKRTSPGELTCAPGTSWATPYATVAPST